MAKKQKAAVQQFMTRTNVPTRSSATTSAFVVTDRSSRFWGEGREGGFVCVHTSCVGGQQGFYSHSLGSLKSREAALYPRQAQLNPPNVAWPHSGRFSKLLPLCLQMHSNGLLNNCAMKDSNPVWLDLVVTSTNTSAGTLPQVWNSSEMTHWKKRKNEKKKTNGKISNLYLSWHTNQLQSRTVYKIPEIILQVGASVQPPK